MKKSSASDSNDYSYLADLNNDPASAYEYHFSGREYLRDLPVRPTRRKRDDNASSTTTTTTATATTWATIAEPPQSLVAPSHGNAASWYRDVRRHAYSFDWKIYIDNATASFPTLLSIVIVTVLIGLQRVVKSQTKYRITSHDDVTTSVLKVNEVAERIKGEKKKHQTHARNKVVGIFEMKQMNEGTIVADSKNNTDGMEGAKRTNIVPTCNTKQPESVDEKAKEGDTDRQSEIHPSIQGSSTQYDEDKIDQNDGVLVTTFDSTVNPTRNTSTETNQFIPPTSLCMTNYPMEEIASRWESKGLNRQKSLELAANFEMNMFFFDQLKLYLAGASFHLFGQMNDLSTRIHDQIDSNHREVMEAPEMEKLRRYREQVPYSLVNVTVMHQCLFLTFAARLYPHVMDVPTLILSSPGNALGAIIANLCPECSIPVTDPSMLPGASYYHYVPYFAMESWGNVFYQMSHAWVCIGRMLWCVFCIGICHRFLSRSASYAILAMVVIPWKDFFVTSGAVLVTNIFLTLWMLNKCKNFELNGKKISHNKEKKATEQRIHYYDWVVPRYQAAAYVSSLAIGFYMASSAK
mmetsp:Transcript_14269/g.27119  ORF Transcript_14269/g.27119 Transcript_14269/m.27119 type:complete len:578 (+) Transcript_14269:305-2038(+)